MNAHVGLGKRLSLWVQGIAVDEGNGEAELISSREASRYRSSREVERRRQLYDDIGGFLFAHDLDLTPVNFGLAHDYLTGNDRGIETAIKAILAQHGQITNGLAEKIVTERNSGELTAEGLSNLLDTVEQNLMHFAHLVDESRVSASDYGDALQASVTDMDGEQTPEQIVSALMGLTRIMLDKTRQVETEMRDNQKRTHALQRSLETARKAAEQDHLTGLPNRRAFEALLKAEVIKAKENHESLSVAICDIDNFKQVNDAHGHDTGDRVLKFVGSLFTEITNEKCHVARHGGEEFVMLLRGKTISEACAVIDETREDLASRHLVDRESGEPMEQISFSGGVADIFGYSSPRDALKAADKALYLAKEHGRNRVYIAPRPGDEA
ncbi:MAG: GGDEF domain-containing protein [Sphingobium sp.]|nr:GGDEF domain-containing protein [Sphingobium sp.]